MNKVVGQIGYGFVGEALSESFKKRGVSTLVYDKYKNIGSFDKILNCDILFLCLPTPFVAEFGFDLTAILDSCKKLEEAFFRGLVVIKSTIEPGTTEMLSKRFKTLLFCHNPEFLTARTANEDFDNQKHIVIGRTADDFIGTNHLAELYTNLYPNAKISLCLATESESMKLFCNDFYAVKVQMFNEFFLLCQRTGADFDKVKEMMLMNGWINKMHTEVPGPDGQLSYGGACFIKDTKALSHFMKKNGTPNKILEACIKERDEMRKD